MGHLLQGLPNNQMQKTGAIRKVHSLYSSRLLICSIPPPKKPPANPPPDRTASTTPHRSSCAAPAGQGIIEDAAGAAAGSQVFAVFPAGGFVGAQPEPLRGKPTPLKPLLAVNTMRPCWPHQVSRSTCCISGNWTRSMLLSASCLKPRALIGGGLD